MAEMEDILLKGGPLDGQQVRKLPGETRRHSERVAGEAVIYLETGQNDPTTGLPLFVFKETPDELESGEGVDA